MIFYILLELSIFVLLTAGIWTQMLVPLWRGTRWFPFLDPRARLERRLQKIRTDLEIQQLEERVELERQQLHHAEKESSHVP